MYVCTHVRTYVVHFLPVTCATIDKGDTNIVAGSLVVRCIDVCIQ